MQERFEQRPRSREHPAPQREMEVTPLTIADSVCRHFGCTLEILRSRRAAARSARRAFAALCSEAGVPLRHAADIMAVTPAAVCMMRAKGASAVAADVAYARLQAAIRSELKLRG